MVEEWKESEDGLVYKVIDNCERKRAVSGSHSVLSHTASSAAVVIIEGALPKY